MNSPEPVHSKCCEVYMSFMTMKIPRVKRSRNEQHSNYNERAILLFFLPRNSRSRITVWCMKATSERTRGQTLLTSKKEYWADLVGQLDPIGIRKRNTSPSSRSIFQPYWSLWRSRAFYSTNITPTKFYAEGYKKKKIQIKKCTCLWHITANNR